MLHLSCLLSLHLESVMSSLNLPPDPNRWLTTSDPRTRVELQGQYTASILRSVLCLFQRSSSYLPYRHALLLKWIQHHLQMDPPCMPGKRLSPHLDRAGQFVIVTFRLPDHLAHHLDSRVCRRLRKRLRRMLDRVFDAQWYQLGYQLWLEKQQGTGFHFHCRLSRIRFHRADHLYAAQFRQVDRATQVAWLPYLLRGPHVTDDRQQLVERLRTPWTNIIRRTLKAPVPRDQQQLVHVQAPKRVQGSLDRYRAGRYRSLLGKRFRTLELLAIRDGQVIGRSYKRQLRVGPATPFNEPIDSFVRGHILDVYTNYDRAVTVGFLNSISRYASVLDRAAEPQGQHGPPPYIDQTVEALQARGRTAPRPPLPSAARQDCRVALPRLTPAHLERVLRVWPVHELFFAVRSGLLEGHDARRQFRRLAHQVRKILFQTFQRVDRRIGFVVQPRTVHPCPPGCSPVGLGIRLSHVCFRKSDARLFDLAWQRLGERSLRFFLAWFRHPPIDRTEVRGRLAGLCSAWQQATDCNHAVFILRGHITEGRACQGAPHRSRLDERLADCRGVYGYFQNHDHRYSRLIRQLLDHRRLEQPVRADQARRGRAAFERLCSQLQQEPADHHVPWRWPHRAFPLRTRMPFWLPKEAFLSA